MATDFFRGRLIGASSVLMGIVFNVDEGYLGARGSALSIALCHTRT